MRVVAVTSRNAGFVRNRTVGSSLYNMAVQLAMSLLLRSVKSIPSKYFSFTEDRIDLRYKWRAPLASRQQGPSWHRRLECLAFHILQILLRLEEQVANDCHSMNTSHVLTLGIVANVIRSGTEWRMTKDSSISPLQRIKEKNGQYCYLSSLQAPCNSPSPISLDFRFAH